jgi:biotin carboxylase
VTVLVLNRSPLQRRPYHEWLHDYPRGVVLLTSRQALAKNRETLPVGGPYLHAEAVADFEGGNDVRQRALDLAHRYPIRYVVAMNERDLEVAGTIRDLLGLPGQSFASANAFRDKLVMKKHAMAAGIPVAPHIPVDSADVLREFAQAQGFPVIVKPRDGAGSIGVRALRNAEDLAALAADPEQWRISSGTAGMLAEGFVHGAMYHVDGMVLDGRVVAAWPSIYHYRPGGLARTTGPRLDVALDPDDPLADRLAVFTERALAALPTPAHTTFHAEMFLTRDDRIVLCEIASRNGGNLINVMLKEMFGVHFPSAWVRACAGLHVPFPRDGSRMLPSVIAGEVTILKRPGLVRAVPAAPPFPWLVHYATYQESGQASAGPATSADIMAAMVVSAPTRAGCEDRLRQASAWLMARLDFGSGSDGDASWVPL